MREAVLIKGGDGCKGRFNNLCYIEKGIWHRKWIQVVAAAKVGADNQCGAVSGEFGVQQPSVAVGAMCWLFICLGG